MGKVLEELSAAVRSAAEKVGPSVVGVGAGAAEPWWAPGWW